MPMMTFNAIDVETANADRESICQIGIVHVTDGKITDQWQTLIDPEDWFDPWNVEIHGIDEAAVKGCPTIPEVRNELRRRLRGSVLVCHTAFDCVAFERAMEKYDLEQLQVIWLDSAKIVKRAWPDQFAVRGWGLANVAKHFKIAFEHHHALEDARVAAEIVMIACRETGIDIPGWIKRVRSPISSPKFAPRIKHEGNVDGPLSGETVVFTGKLSVLRSEINKTAIKAGCNVHPNVTKKTTILTVGVYGGDVLSGYEKSRKHRRAEVLIGKGAEIQILSEKDFNDLIIKSEAPHYG